MYTVTTKLRTEKGLVGVLRGSTLVTGGNNGEFAGMKLSWQYLFVLLVKICFRLGIAFGNEGDTERGSRKFVYAAEKEVENFELSIWRVVL
jgi:hypothetical protein